MKYLSKWAPVQLMVQKDHVEIRDAVTGMMNGFCRRSSLNSS